MANPYITIAETPIPGEKGRMIWNDLGVGRLSVVAPNSSPSDTRKIHELHIGDTLSKIIGGKWRDALGVYDWVIDPGGPDRYYDIPVRKKYLTE